jgi:hypothetical protein
MFCFLLSQFSGMVTTRAARLMPELLCFEHSNEISLRYVLWPLRHRIRWHLTNGEKNGVPVETTNGYAIQINVLRTLTCGIDARSANFKPAENGAALAFQRVSGVCGCLLVGHGNTMDG